MDIEAWLATVHSVAKSRTRLKRLSTHAGGPSGKESTCQRHRFDPWVGKISLEEGMATHSRILAWRIPWTEEPSGLQSIGLQRDGHN